ncbi:MAG: HAD family phosphatase [Clostridia bacterium]|nr:HAD family phosphatase [Clostridia bacterium]
MYKLVAVDLDGTLLDSYGEVSEKNRKAVKQAMDRGIEIVLASGRPMESVRSISLDIGASKYIICGNGAIVYDIEKDETVYENYLDKDKVLKIVKICEENSIYCSVYTDKTIIAKSLNYNVLYYNHENAKKEEVKRTHINIVENMYKYIQNLDTKKFSKITICDSNKIIFERILQKIKKIKKIDILDLEYMSRKVIKNGTEKVSIEYFYTEISNQNVNKWYAIQSLIDKLEIDEDEIVAIGDNKNDEMMVNNASLGVAMGNSYLSSKKIGNVTVANNDESGFSEAIAVIL